MSQTTLALIRSGGATDELGAIAQITADEVRHTELSRDLADKFGGYIADIPEGLAYAPQLLSDPSTMSLEFWIVGNGCISETVSLALMRARLKHTHHPIVRQVLSRILKDEAVHARMGWVLAERVLPGLSQVQRYELADYALASCDMIGKSFATGALPESLRRTARRMRTRTAAQGLGACPPDEGDAVCLGTLRDIALPRLAKLGLPIQRAA